MEVMSIAAEAAPAAAASPRPSRQLLPELGHVHVHGAGAGGGIRVPELVHELLTREGLLRIGQQLVEDVELPHGQGHCLAVERRLPLVQIHDEPPHLQPMARGDLRAAQQSPDPEQQLVEVDGLGHVVVDSDPAAPLHGEHIVLRRHEISLLS